MNKRMGLIIVFVLIFSFILCGTVSAKGTWNKETVDHLTSTGRWASSAVDSAGNPHIAYYDTTTKVWKYAYKDSNKVWHKEKIDNAYKLDRLSTHFLAVDKKGNPHFVYNSQDGLRYAYKDTKWHTEVINPDNQWYASIATDSENNPHISYKGNIPGNTNGGLVYAFRADSTWYFNLIDPSYSNPSSYYSDSGYYSSIVIDHHDNPHLAAICTYYDVTAKTGSTSLKYYSRSGYKWTSETAFTRPGGLAIPIYLRTLSVSLNPQDRPHIVYKDIGGNNEINLYYIYRDTAWHTEKINVNAESALSSDIAVDKYGKPHIAYDNLEKGAKGYISKIIYLNKTGTTWNNPVTIDTIINTDYGYTNGFLLGGICINNKNEPQISYWESVECDLEYAYFKTDNTPPTIRTNYPSGWYKNNLLVKLYLNEKGTIFYTVDGTDPITNWQKAIEYEDLGILISKNTILKYYAYDELVNISMVFTRKYYIDKKAPTITATYPPNQKTGFSRSSNIYIKFSEKIKASNNWKYILIKNLKTNKYVPVKKTISKNILILKTSSRTRQTWYQLIIPAKSIKDIVGNNLTKTTNIKFKTKT